MDANSGQVPLTSAIRLTRHDLSGRPCLFLDRDGVLVEEVNYLHRTDDVAFIPGVVEAIAAANSAGVAVVMVTNQAGIGRGYYDWPQFDTVQDFIFTHCRRNGANYDMALACGTHPEGAGHFAVDGHLWRKPLPGMLLAAAEQLGIDLGRSHIIGDMLTDLEAGARAGLPTGTLVATGHGARAWEAGGETKFAELASLYAFQADRAADAGVAIMRWLQQRCPQGAC